MPPTDSLRRIVVGAGDVNLPTLRAERAALVNENAELRRQLQEGTTARAQHERDISAIRADTQRCAEGRKRGTAGTNREARKQHRDAAMRLRRP